MVVVVVAGAVEMKTVAVVGVELELTDAEIAGVDESVAASSQKGGIAEAEGRVVLSAVTTAGKSAPVGESAGATTSVLGQVKTGVGSTSGENRAKDIGRHGVAVGQAKAAAALGTEACELSSPGG